MRSQDRNNLIISGVLIGIILIVACIWAGTRYLPLVGIAGVSLALEIAYFMPMVCKKVYLWYGYNESIHWIPYVNVIQCFSKTLSVLSIVFTILGIFCLFFLKMPAAVHKLFGENFMIDYGDSVFYYGIVFLLLVSIVWGVGYTSIYRDVKAELSTAGLVGTISDVMFVLLLFIPCLRVIGLITLNSNLDAVLNMTIEEDEDEFEEVEYDE